MKTKIFQVLTLIFLNLFFISNINAKLDCKRNFSIKDGKFLYNGNPYIIKAAELHYPRIPKEYWNQRIQMSKALGMNTICLYVFWNFHEQEEGEIDFTGDKNLREFIELCDANGMNVILRPGPYVCAEWEMGGLPWWLLKDRDIKLRENDPKFLEKVERFQKAIAEQVVDLTVDKGGPIIMIQVENEYGAYGENKEYLKEIRDILDKLYGKDIVKFQCDWSSNFTLNGLDDLLWTINFGAGAEIDSQFKELKEIRPESPLMCSEYWSGWFDKWGASHETRSTNELTEGIDEMLSKNISFSLYMTHGGTNWGHWAGANSPGYSPDVTSYDYDAPINENGQPTEKYWELKKILDKYQDQGRSDVRMPELIQPIQIDKFILTEVAPLYRNLPQPVFSDSIKTIEELGMGFGSVQYTTILPLIEEGTQLEVNDAHDYAQIFINDKKIGTLDRRYGDKKIRLEAYPEGAKLDILVEAMGRINFGRAIKDYKGITDDVRLIYPDKKSKILSDWNIYLLPDNKEFYDNMYFQSVSATECTDTNGYPRGVYRGYFNVEKPSDTFLNFETWGKGVVYVNGKGLGRIWNEGPQQTLYTPGPWLKEGENEILIFDILGPNSIEIEGLDKPIIDQLRTDTPKGQTEIINEDNNNWKNIGEFNLSGNVGWETVRFEKNIKTDNVIVEISETYDENGHAAIAELYLIDEHNERISREKWKISGNSQDFDGNHTADKIIDLQESTYWRSNPNENGQYLLTIILEKEEEISGFEILPRMETGSPEAIKTIRINVNENLE